MFHECFSFVACEATPGEVPGRASRAVDARDAVGRAVGSSAESQAGMMMSRDLLLFRFTFIITPACS